MSIKYMTLTALGAALLLTACGTSLGQDRLAVTRNAGLLPFGKVGPSTPETSKIVPVAWEVLASPVTISPAGPEGAASKVGGHAVLQTAAHDVPKRYRVTWSGLRDTRAETPTRLTLRDAQGDRALVLHFEDDRLRVINGAEDDFPRLTYSATKAHDVTVILTMGKRPTVAIDIREDKIPLYTTPPVDVLDRGFSELDALEIEVSAKGTTYHISDFEAVPTKG